MYVLYKADSERLYIYRFFIVLSSVAYFVFWGGGCFWFCHGKMKAFKSLHFQKWRDLKMKSNILNLIF